MVSAEVTSDGELSFGGHIVGRLQGFRFTPAANPDAERDAIDASDIVSAIAQEFEVRANRFSEAVDAALVLANDGAIRWLGDPVAKIAAGETMLAPRALILVDESLSESARQKVQSRVELWLNAYVKRLLGPLFELEAAVGLEGPAQNVALQLARAQGVLERSRVAQDVKALDQNARGALRKLGVRFGAYHIYIPSLVKPAIRVLATQLWALGQGAAGAGAGLDDISQLAASGRTSFLADAAIAREAYRVAGFRLCGDRAVRVDIVERLADLIRPAVAYRPGPNAGTAPAGAADGDGFVVTSAMTSLTGCSGEQFASVLRSLGFASHRVKAPALTIVAPPAPSGEAPSEPPAESSAATPTAAAQSEAAADVVTAEDQSAPPPIEISTIGGDAPEAGPSGEIAVGPGDADQAGAAIALEAEASKATALSNGAALDMQAEVAEEALVEVWRPRPPPHRPRRPHAGSANGAPVRLQAEGEQPGERRDGPERPRHRRHRPSHTPSQQASAEAGSQSNSESPGPRQDSNRPSRWRDAPRPFDSAAKQDGGAERRGGPHKARGRDDRKQNERSRENMPAPQARREQPVDLNSPFAKLLALKSQLEAKGKN
jgi:ATP-dependent RNA helicase SUPV3L1/SUV3